MVSTGTSTDAPLPCEKRRALFHSTLEPKHQRCSASLSQSQRSFTFVSSISTLLNKGGTHANVLVLLRTSVLQQNKHKHSSAQPFCSNLVRRHERSEGRRSRSEEQTQSNTHFFKDALKHLQRLSAHHAHFKQLKTSLKQAQAMPCKCLFFPKQATGFKRSFTLMQSKLKVHPTCARHHINCKGTHKEVKNFHINSPSQELGIIHIVSGGKLLCLETFSTGL